jgi:UDP-N-acetylmuramoyl-tripeptide--D-alanyl-D-alanine ligase
LAAACDIECHEHGIRFTLVDGPRVTMPAHGRHQVYAALAAAAVARLRGMPDEQIVRGLSQMQAAPMRCEVHRIGAVTLINDAYNANPLSMQAAAAMLAEWPARGRRILVCGDMLELGAAGVDRHRRLGDSVARRGVIGHLIAVGPLSRWTAEAAVAAGMPARDVKHCMTADHAVVELSRLVGAGDVIVVKASRGLRLERVAEAVLRACGSLPAAA